MLTVGGSAGGVAGDSTRRGAIRAADADHGAACLGGCEGLSGHMALEGRPLRGRRSRELNASAAIWFRNLVLPRSLASGLRVRLVLMYVPTCEMRGHRWSGLHRLAP